MVLGLSQNRSGTSMGVYESILPKTEAASSLQHEEKIGTKPNSSTPKKQPVSRDDDGRH